MFGCFCFCSLDSPAAVGLRMSCVDMPCCRADSSTKGQIDLMGSNLLGPLNQAKAFESIQPSLDLGCYIVCNQTPSVDSGDLFCAFSFATLLASYVPVPIPDAAPLSKLFKEVLIQGRPHWKRPDPPPQMRPNPPPIRLSYGYPVRPSRKLDAVDAIEIFPPIVRCRLKIEQRRNLI